MTTMERHSGEIAVAMELGLIVPLQPSLPLPVQLRYSSRDPYAVTLVFSGPDEDVMWVFARDLLAGGLVLPRGQGDVRVRPEIRDGSKFIMIGLTSPDGTAELEADATQIASFIAQTEALVPRGSEHTVIDLDQALAALLG